MTAPISTGANGQIDTTVREKIVSFEQAMLQVPGVKTGNMEECPLTHSFAGGIYVRQILIPKGYLITGKIHRQDHPIFIMVGDVSLASEGLGTVRLKGPCHFISKAGTKRLLYTHEDTVFVTVHDVGEERDVPTIEKLLTADTYQEYEEGLKCLS